MSRATYVIGPPGVGKTTYLQQLIRAERAVLPAVRVLRLLKGEPLANRADGTVDALHLGVTRPGGFSGTDALSMGVQPDAISWARSGANANLSVYGEGQRLANLEFLSALASVRDLTVIYLTAPSDVLDERCERRGSQQSRSWRQGAATRAARCAERCTDAGMHVVVVDATKEEVRHASH